MMYFDNAATTPLDPAVLDAMMPYLSESYGNAGASYALGRASRDAVSHAREQVARFLRCRPEQVIFTSGGSEANSTVFFGLRHYLREHDKTHLLTSVTEHDSVRRAVEEMCIKDGFGAGYVGVNHKGVVSVNDLRASISDRTGLISVMYVNNETGAENPVEAIGKLCHESHTLFMTDCVQAAGSHVLDVTGMGCDFLTISSHKIHGPKGVGALFAKDPSILSPLICGGGMQEHGLRGGTENVPGIVGFGQACELADMHFTENAAHIATMRWLFYDALHAALSSETKGSILHLNGDPCGKIMNLRFDGVHGETLLLMLDAYRVCVSSGSACRSHASEPSHVLTAMGLTAEEAESSIRVSFSHMNTSDEVIDAATILARCVCALSACHQC